MVIPEENRSMFNAIAKGYDKTNDLITLGRHKSWYRQMVRLSRLTVGSSIIDCATGTGNVAIVFKSYFKDNIAVTGIDVAENMLLIARNKAEDENLSIDFICGDILNLPFQNDIFDLATISFGIRNTESIEKCLCEMARVVKSGGKVIILETGRMKGINKIMFSFYQKIFVKTIGRFLTGNKSAYDYFVDSSNNFPSGKEFTDLMMKTEQFSAMGFQRKMFGTIFLYIGTVK